jgi:hypothetical protein
MKQRVKPQIIASHISEDIDLDEPTPPANPIAPFPLLTHKKLNPVTRAPRGRALEFYGLVGWLVTLLRHVLLLLWALLPDKVIHGLECTGIPQGGDLNPRGRDCSYTTFVREWALLLPSLSSYWRIRATSRWEDMGRHP